MRRTLPTLLLLGGLRGRAVADVTLPPPPAPPPAATAASAASPGTAVVADAAPPREVGQASPWVDVGGLTASPAWAAGAARTVPPPSAGRPLLAAGIVAGLYANFAAWTYYAWYRHHKPLGEFAVGGDGWFGERTYAGGADKLGHAWATLGLGRLGTEVLAQVGGVSRWRASLLGCGLAELLFVLVEVKDGLYYELSPGDLVGDSAGAALALALSNLPRLDELVDFRVEYKPSRAYLDQLRVRGNVNVAEDYSGETFLLALHLGAVGGLGDRPWGRWARFVDLTAGYGTRGYKPPPVEGAPPPVRSQERFLGVSLNAQGVLDWLLAGPGATRRRARKAAHGVFEMFNLPYTSAPLLESNHRVTGAVDPGGA